MNANKHGRKFHYLMAGALLIWLGGCGPKRDAFTAAPPSETAPVENRVIIKKQIPVPAPNEKKVFVLPPKTNTKTNEVTVKEKVIVPAPQEPNALSEEPGPKPTSPPARVIRNVVPRPKIKPTPAPTKPRPKPTSKPAKAAENKGSLVVQGEVVQVSKMPDPKSVPYKESLVFIKYKVLSVQRGEYSGKEILVAHWGMKDKKLLPAARSRIGEKRRLVLEPLDDHPELESVMQNNDIQDFELTPYFASG